MSDLCTLVIMVVNFPPSPLLLLRQPAISVVETAWCFGSMILAMSRCTYYCELEDHIMWFLHSSVQIQFCYCCSQRLVRHLKCPSASRLKNTPLDVDAGGSPPSSNHLYVSFHTIFNFHTTISRPIQLVLDRRRPGC